MNLSNDERLNLKRLIDQSDCENNTNNIRKLKHSLLIRDDIRKMEILKKSEESLRINDPEAFSEKLKNECSFLYTNYTDLFHKLLKDELDLDIMKKLLIVLKLIEDEKVDQHEGSCMVGKLLKELYVDSALRRSDNLDKEYGTKPVEKESGKNISWREFKVMRR
jgi:hypothetical protein